MKRFSNVVINTLHVLAVVPCRGVLGALNSTTPPARYEVVFHNGDRIVIDTEAAAALMDALVPPVTDPTDRPPQPDRRHGS